MLQYRDVLAQYGEQGLREIVMNDKSIPANQKEATIRKVLDSDYTKNLLDNFNQLQHSETGSLNEYITRIYKDEFANPVDPDVDMQGYVDQVTEREAYNLGSERLGNNTQELDQFELNDDWTREQGFTIHESSNGVKFKVYDDGTIERINSNAPKGVVSNTPTTELTFADFSDINKINELIMNTLKENATYLTDGTQRVSGYLNKNLANIIEVLPDDTPQAVIDKLVELSNNPKATIYDAINEIHVLATPTQKLPVDVAARKALASLYDEIIVNAKKEGNTRRVGIYEQAKNNISQMEKETVYKQFLDYCYRKIRYSDYSMSTVDFNINDVTSIETDKIRVKNEGGWFYRLPKNGYGEITHRISINAKGDPNLIKALDDLFGNGEVKGYYKTPDTADNWTMRHDPITIYLEEKPTPEILEKVRVACEKYVRSTDDVLTGNKFAPGFAWEISPNKSIIEEMLNRAKTIDADLENVLRIYFTKTDTKGNPRLTASAAEYSAAKILLESMQ